jgi:hypothetical protein
MIAVAVYLIDIFCKTDLCDEQFWDLRVPTGGGDTELHDAYRRNIQIPISIYVLWCPRK